MPPPRKKTTHGHATVADYQTRWGAVEVRKLRQRLRLSQEAFAHLLGTTFSTVSRWENGKAVPSYMGCRLLDQIARGE